MEIEKLMSTSYNSLSMSRCQTPSSLSGTAAATTAASMTNSTMTIRPHPSPKCFGKNTHMLKEEYERDRVRWQQKLEEAEQKLSEASIQNSELFQTKAELKRKIIDLEKNQRPLIEQNRRQNDRIRTLNAEIKKLDDKLAFQLNDFLTLRDNNERVLRENSLLKEQRAFPEKLEELNRYRNQVLEYSKCITALRQSAIEKDRRYELLLHKFKRVKKALPKRSAATAAEDDDHQSCIGSEGSIESGSLLDTITEDIDEDLDLTSDFLRPPLSNMEYSLKQQLDLANLSISELQNALDNSETERVLDLTTMVNRLQENIDSLTRRDRTLEQQLANEQQHNELLEFQVLELTTQLALNRTKEIGNISDKQCSTTLSVPIENYDDEELMVELGTPKKRHKIASQFVAESTQGLFETMASPILHRNERLAIKNSIEIIDCLQNQLSLAETELNMANCEVERLRRQIEEDADHNKRIIKDELGGKQKKKELLLEIDQLRRENREQARRFNKQIQDNGVEIEAKSRQLSDKEHRTHELNEELETMRIQVDILRDRVSIEESTRTELNLKIAQFEEQKQDELANLREELAKLRQQYDQKVKSLVADNAKSRDYQSEIETLKQTVQSLGNGNSPPNSGGKKNSPQRKVQYASSFHSHIERRYEEQRNKVAEFQRHINKLEDQVEKDRKLIAQLRDGSTLLKQIEQLQAYNRELEAQFNTQMDMITALKKKLILKSTNSNGGGENIARTPSEIWKLNKDLRKGATNGGGGSPSVSSDEQYHSEGSDGVVTTAKLSLDI